MTLTMWARRIYLAGIVGALLVYLPFSWFPLMAGKVAIAAVLFFVAGLLYALAWRRGHAVPPPRYSWLLALLPIAYTVSYAFSADRALGVMGTGLGVDTIYFTTLLAAAGVLAAGLFRTSAEAWLFVRTVLLASVAAGIFQLLVLAGVPGLFADHSVNLIGKWNDFGLMVTLAVFLLLVTLEFGWVGMRGRVLAWVGLVGGLVLLCLVNFSTAWGVLLALALSMLLAVWLSGRRVAWGAALAGIVAVVFLFFGAALNADLSKVIPVSSLEVRPALQSTFDVTTAAHGSSAKDAAVGTGPNTFGLSWLAYKPASVNQSPFWNLDFIVGFSTLATAFSTVGLLGAIMWLVPLVVVLAGLWRLRGEDKLTAWVLAALVVLWWVAIALYVPSANLLVAAFAFAGVALGAAHGTHVPRLRALSSLAMLVLVLALAWGAGAGTRRALAESYVGQATAAQSAGSVDSARTLAQRSVAVEPMPENLRLLVATDAAKLVQLAPGATTTQSQKVFTDLLQQTLTVGGKAIASDPQDYLSYLTIGQLYDYLASNKVQGAYDNAKSAYAKAAQLSPLNPTIPLLAARLEAQSGSTAGLQTALKQSLTLKPDYTDAILFLAQVDIARNDLASAIKDTQVAAQTAPGVPSIWLELGVLYYAGGDTKDAIAPLEQALKIEPDYANAQYYLGLAYDAQGRHQDAIALFQKLNQTNPVNAQIQSVLSNLQAGKPALSTSTPATSAR